VQQFQASGATTRAGGSELLDVELSALTPNAFKDLAIHPDGRIFLSRAGPTNPYVSFPGPTPTAMPSGSPPLNAIDVLAQRRRYQTRRDGAPVHAEPLTWTRTASPMSQPLPQPLRRREGGPQPTPRPSRPVAGRVVGLLRPSRPKPPLRVLVFSPALRCRARCASRTSRTSWWGRPAFLSRGTEIFALGEREPLYVSPAGRMYTAFFGEVVFNLDVPAAGGVLASMNHCFFQGVAHLPQPADRPAAALLSGALDQPELEGPAYPLRLDAEEDVGVLQGRFTISTRQPVPQYLVPYYGRAGGADVAPRWHAAQADREFAQTNSNTVRDVAMTSNVPPSTRTCCSAGRTTSCPPGASGPARWTTWMSSRGWRPSRRLPDAWRCWTRARTG
jgi:hypothetical protein